MSHVCSGKKKFNLSPILYPDINYSSEVNRVKRLFLKEIVTANILAPIMKTKV